MHSISRAAGLTSAEYWGADRAKGIICALARLIGDKYMAHQQSLQGQIDHRLKQQINEKKLALGLKIEGTQKPSYQTEEEYEQSM